MNDRAFYENNANSLLHYFWNMENSFLSEAGRNNVELVLNIFAFSDINKHIEELSRDIQIHSEACVTLVYSEPWHNQNPCISRNLEYLEPGDFQNTGTFRTRAIFRTPVYSGSEAYSQPCQASAIERFTKIIPILLCTIFKYCKVRPWRERSQ